MLNVENVETRNCPICSKAFIPRKHNHVRCSTHCGSVKQQTNLKVQIEQARGWAHEVLKGALSIREFQRRVSGNAAVRKIAMTIIKRRGWTA